jgi:membrane protein required for colicin V production
MIFSLFDILIITILLISSILGMYKGIIDITINLLGFAASIVAAIIFYPYIHQLFAEYIDNELATSVISGIVSYIISLIVFTFLTSKVVLLFKDVGKGTFDKFLGLLAGVVRGGLLALIIFAITAIFTAGTYSKLEKAEDLVNKLSMEDYPVWLKDSITTPYLERTLKTIVSLVPEEFWEHLKFSDKTEDGDIIDAIKKRKDKDKKSIIDLNKGN